MNTMYACKNAGRAGSTPVVGTTFPLENGVSDSTEPKLKELNLNDNFLTDVPKGLEKLTQLTTLNLDGNQLTDVKGLEKLTQLKVLALSRNQLTDVKGLERLTQLTRLILFGNPDLTKAQIDRLQKALPEAVVYHRPTK